MENAIISVICIVLLLFGGMTMSQGFLSSVDSNAASWTQMGERDSNILRTEISNIISTDPGEGIGGLANVYIALTNAGQTKLADFDEWDVIVQYYDTGGSKTIKWLPYTSSSPGDNEWTVAGIYLDADAGTPEVFEPGILNPGEELKLQVKLNPMVGDETTNFITISTPNGIPASAFFRGYDVPEPPES